MTIHRDYRAAYQVLGVEFGAPISVVRPAYITKLKGVHPDHHGVHMTSLASAINAAFDEVKHYLEHYVGADQYNRGDEANDAWQKAWDASNPKKEEPAPKKTRRNTRGFNPLRDKVLTAFYNMEMAGKPQSEILKFVMNEYDISWANAYYYWGRVYKKRAA